MGAARLSAAVRGLPEPPAFGRAALRRCRRSARSAALEPRAAAPRARRRGDDRGRSRRALPRTRRGGRCPRPRRCRQRAPGGHGVQGEPRLRVMARGHARPVRRTGRGSAPRHCAGRARRRECRSCRRAGRPPRRTRSVRRGPPRAAGPQPRRARRSRRSARAGGGVPRLFRRELGVEPSPAVRRAAGPAAEGEPVAGDSGAARAHLEGGTAAVGAGAVEHGVGLLRRACAEALACGDGVVHARALPRPRQRARARGARARRGGLAVPARGGRRGRGCRRSRDLGQRAARARVHGHPGRPPGLGRAAAGARRRDWRTGTSSTPPSSPCRE